MIFQTACLEGSALTVALAIKARDGILLVTDKRETSTSAQIRGTDAAQKIRQVARNCCIAFSGDPAIAITCLEEFERTCEFVDCTEDRDASAMACLLWRFLDQKRGGLPKSAGDGLETSRFLVVGYAKDATGRRSQCVKRLQSDAGFVPLDCVGGAVASDSLENWGSLGRDGLLYYYRRVLGVDFVNLTLQHVLPIAAFILSETSATGLDVGSTLDVFEIRESSCTPVIDFSRPRFSAESAQADIREILRSFLLPPDDSTR